MIDDPAPSRRRLAVACGLAALVTAVVWAAAATWYVGAERIVYWWDYMMWWKWTVMLMGQMLTAPATALASVRNSLSFAEYPLLPAVPLAVWCAAAGTTRLPFVLGITTIYGAAAAAALAYLCLGRSGGDRASGQISSRPPSALLPLVAVPPVVFICWSPPFVTSMRGFPDVGAVAISYLILGLYFSAPQRGGGMLRLAACGGLLGLLFVFRRYWAYWVTSFAVLVTLDALWLAWRLRRESGRAWLRPLAVPVTIGLGSACVALALAWPMVLRVARTDYADVYSAYQLPAAGGLFAEIGQTVTDLLATNGVLAAFVGVASIAGLVARRDTRRVGVMLGVLPVLAYVQFRRVQGAGLHHHLLWSSLLTAATAAFAASLVARLPPRRAWGVVMAFVLIGSVQWAAAVVPAAPLRRLMLGSTTQLPLVRMDLAELERLVTAIDVVAMQVGKAPKIYCLASSSILNQGILYSYSPSLLKPFRSALLVGHTSDIDKRDGFPQDLVTADLVIVCDPPQVHQGEENQQVIVEPVRKMLAGEGIGEPFERVQAEFVLEGGVKTYLFVRTRPMERKHVAALSDALRQKYPDRPFVYEYLPR